LSYIGINCFETAKVAGHKRDPVPPARTMPFMARTVIKKVDCYKRYNHLMNSQGAMWN